MLEWKGCVRRMQRDLVMFVLCFWVIASHISTCNANMPAGQMRFLALSLQGCQGETQGTQQQHKWNQPTPPTSATFQSYTKLGSLFRVPVMAWVRSCVYSCKLRWKFATHYFHMSAIGNESAAIFCTIFGSSGFVCCGFYAKLLFCLSAWTVYCMRQSVGCVVGVCLCVCVYDVGVLAFTTTAQKCIYTQ